MVIYMCSSFYAQPARSQLWSVSMRDRVLSDVHLFASWSVITEVFSKLHIAPLMLTKVHIKLTEIQ